MRTNFDYRGYVLVPAFNPSGQVVSAICEEINFSMYSLNTYPWITYSSVIEKFKKKVDEIMNNKVPTSEPEKELNRLKNLLENEPAVFYGTGQVYDLLTLCEDLVKVSKKKDNKTKKLYELRPKDVVIESNRNQFGVISKIEIADRERGIYRVFFETNSPPNLGTYKYNDTFIYLHNISDLESKPEKKRVEQLVVGDVVIFPNCKGFSTIDLIKKIDGDIRYGISTKEVNSLGIYLGNEEVIYLRNEKDNAK